MSDATDLRAERENHAVSAARLCDPQFAGEFILVTLELPLDAAAPEAAGQLLRIGLAEAAEMGQAASPKSC